MFVSHIFVDKTARSGFPCFLGKSYFRPCGHYLINPQFISYKFAGEIIVYFQNEFNGL